MQVHRFLTNTTALRALFVSLQALCAHYSDDAPPYLSYAPPSHNSYSCIEYGDIIALRVLARDFENFYGCTVSHISFFLFPSSGVRSILCPPVTSICSHLFYSTRFVDGIDHEGLCSFADIKFGLLMDRPYDDIRNITGVAA